MLRSPKPCISVALIICQTVTLMRSGHHKGYAVVLILLFGMVVTHLGANWKILRDVFISHNDTQNTMTQEAFDDPTLAIVVANVAAFMAAWLGDSLLVCIGTSPMLVCL